MQAFEELEGRLQKFTGLPFVAVCSSGTAALHLALEALQLPRGSVVALPDYTMVACARAVHLAGLTPVFVGCGPDLQMNVHLLDRACSENSVRAVIAVHVYGRYTDMAAVHHLAKKWSLKVIEDMAEAHCQMPHMRSTACYSFYRNKVVAGEEGGCVAGDFLAPITLVKSLRSMGFTPAHDFDHEPRGCNYRMPNCCAKLILESLDRFEWAVHRRREIESAYDNECPADWRMPERITPWVYDIRIPGLKRNRQRQIVETLNVQGIAARMGFLPMSQQKEFAGYPKYWGADVNLVADEVFYLPLDPFMVHQPDKAFELIQAAL